MCRTTTPKRRHSATKLMAQTHLEQKIKDSHFKARNRGEDRPAIGAPSKGNGKTKGKANNMPKKSERGDCIRWTTKSAFKHEPSNKGKGKGLRSPSPTDSPQINSKGYGNGCDDGGAQGEPKRTGKCSPGKANRPPCVNFKDELIHAVIGNIPECAKFKSPAGCRFGDK